MGFADVSKVSSLAFVCVISITPNDLFYSDLKLFTGFINAALIA